MNPPIFALATAPGRAAVAVMRLSGADLSPILKELGAGPPAPRRASLRRLRSAEGGTLDEALVVWMPAPASFTGEDCAELHLHGGPAIVTAVGARLQELGVTSAEPGEFTRRAFEAGRFDLVQAEAVADLVDAETEAQRRQALDQLGGAASRLHHAWRERLLHILAQLEAAVDFPDEELPDDLAGRVRPAIADLADELEGAAGDRRGERVREGFRVALVGAPNVGKSSLFNALLGRDAAIVTDIAGTTRDVIEAELVLGGRKVILADLAGLRDSADPIEQEGVRRAHAWLEAADLRLHLSTAPQAIALGASDLVVVTKADLGKTFSDVLSVSAVTGLGLVKLRDEIEKRAIAATTGATAPAATRERHRTDLHAASSALRGALKATEPEIAAEDVRLAARSLERLSGQIDAEAVLDRVFASFCVGK